MSTLSLTTPAAQLAETVLDKADMSEKILSAKVQQGLSWQQLAEQIGVNDVWLASACLGMNSMNAEQAEKLCRALALPDSVKTALMVCPAKNWSPAVPQDPLIYRLYEIVGVYGETLKEIIHEQFGDGIMSAIDFSMTVGKEENPVGDRVVITLNGKFLPYKSW